MAFDIAECVAQSGAFAWLEFGKLGLREVGESEESVFACSCTVSAEKDVSERRLGTRFHRLDVAENGSTWTGEFFHKSVAAG